MYKIIPSTDLRNKYSKIAEYAKQNHKPIVLTKNGEGDLIIMSIELFEEKEIELQLYKRLAENKIDITKGHYQSGAEFSEQLRKYIKHDNTDLVNELKEIYLRKDKQNDV
jgi:prevent-host-death family protein